MNSLADFHFIRPGWFLLVPVVLVVWWLGMKARDVLHGWRRQIDPELLGALTTEPVAVGGGPLRSPHVMLIGWLVAVVAIAGPTWRPEPSPFADDPVPVMLLLGAGESMDREDLMPSRMERARLKVVDFANGRKGLPVGLIAYSGSAHLVLPPHARHGRCRDHGRGDQPRDHAQARRRSSRGAPARGTNTWPRWWIGCRGDRRCHGGIGKRIGIIQTRVTIGRFPFGHRARGHAGNDRPARRGFKTRRRRDGHDARPCRRRSADQASFQVCRDPSAERAHDGPSRVGGSCPFWRLSSWHHSDASSHWQPVVRRPTTRWNVTGQTERI